MTYGELFLEIKERNEWQTETDGRHELQFAVEVRDGCMFLLFQESNGKLDWRDNFNILPNKVSCCSGKVVMSEGTNLAYKCGRDAVRAAVSDALVKNPGLRVVAAGWSHGGGVAVRACIDLNHTLNLHPNLVTFGAPKVLWGDDSALHAWLCCRRAIQFGHVNDIVTKVAPGARHVAERVLTKGRVWLVGSLNPWHFHTKYDRWCDGLGNVYGDAE